MENPNSVAVSDIKIEIAAPKTNIVAANAFVTNATALEIDCHEMQAYAKTELDSIMNQRKTLEKMRVDGKAPLLQATRNWDGMFNPAIETLTQAETIIKGKMASWVREQQRLAAIEQKRLDDEAEAERKRQRDIAAEIQRVADEEARVAREEADRVQAAAEETARIALEAAAEAARQGNEETAERIRVQAEADQREADERAEEARRLTQERADAARLQAQSVTNAAAVQVATRVAPIAGKPKGMSVTQTYKAEGVDLLATVKAIAAGDVGALNLLMFNQPAINSMVKAQKGHFKVPGIRVWTEDKVANRTAAAA